MIVAHTAAARPDLCARAAPSSEVWPEYNTHGDVANRYWRRLAADLPEYQFVLYDDERDAVVAEGHTGPFWWDGDDATLPGSFDATIERVFAELDRGAEVNTLTALAAEVPRREAGHGLARLVLAAMRDVAASHCLTHLVAPVRPMLKHEHPLVGIEEYVAWRRDDGEAFDPWIRLHERAGARIATPLPESFGITGTVGEWETWIGTPFPTSGDFVFPEGLATVHIDRDADLGTYWEPNVWLVHPDLDEAV